MQISNSKNFKLLISQYLPHNFLAEKMILNCLLVNPKIIERTLQTISIDVFYFKNHREIYKAIIIMYENNIQIDILTLVTFLQENGLLKKVGGIKVLIELLNQIPNTIYLEEYLKLVKDKYIRRSLIKIGYETINSSYVTNLPLEHILNTLENKLFTLTSGSKIQKLSSSSEVLKTIFSELKIKSINPTLSGLSSGFYELDTITQGFQKSDLIIIAGRPSSGKTALSLNIALNILKNYKLPVLFFSLEMTKEQIMYRLLAMETNINLMRLKNGKLYQNDWLKLNKIIKILSEFPFFVDDTFNLSIQDIRSKIKTILFEHNELSLVVIDYIQLMNNSNFKAENRVQELSKITRSLKMVAREFNLPIIGLSQLSRNIESRVNKKPILSDLRESGSLEQDSDLVLMIYKKIALLDHKTSDVLELIIAKQRNGPTGSIQLQFNSKQTKFQDLNAQNQI